VAKGRSIQEPGALDPPVSHITISIRSCPPDCLTADRQVSPTTNHLLIVNAGTAPQPSQFHVHSQTLWNLKKSIKGVSHATNKRMKRLDWLALKSVFACLCTDMEMIQMQERGRPEDDIAALMRKHGDGTSNDGKSNGDE
jgi:hypothetical protein